MLSYASTWPGHYRPASKTLFEWRFAGGPIVARTSVLTKYMLYFLELPIIVKQRIVGPKINENRLKQKIKTYPGNGCCMQVYILY